jgi:hypothetical protein
MSLEWVIPKGIFQNEKDYKKACFDMNNLSNGIIYHFIPYDLYRAFYKNDEV